jgi:hypothetical protein
MIGVKYKRLPSFYRHTWNEELVIQLTKESDLKREVMVMADMISRLGRWLLDHITTIGIFDAILTLIIWLSGNDLGCAILGLLGLMIIDFFLGAIIVPFAPHTPHKFSSRVLFVKAFSKIVLYSILISSFALAGMTMKSFIHNAYVQMIVDFLSVGFIFSVLILFELGSILEHFKTLGWTVKFGKYDLTSFITEKLDQTMQTIKHTQPNQYQYGMWGDNTSMTETTSEDLDDMNP